MQCLEGGCNTQISHTLLLLLRARYQLVNVGLENALISQLSHLILPPMFFVSYIIDSSY